MRLSLVVHFLANVVRDLRGSNSSARSMLINISRFVLVQKYIKEWVDKEYETGRVTAITDSELEKVIKESSEKLGINF